MTMSLRHRVGLALAGLVIGAPLLGMSVANAAATAVTFSGTPLLGLDTLACPSTPSVSSLALSPGMTVNFVNRTGRTATLWADSSKKSLPDKSMVPVTFAHGPAVVTIQMVPDCALDLGAHAQMKVNVSGPGQAPTSAPTDGTGLTGADPTGTPRVGASSKAPLPGHSATAIAPATSTPDGGSRSKAGTDSGANTPTDIDDPFAMAQVPNVVVGDVANPSGSGSASGLLTLIATVGVVGVSAAAIRAIIAQRAIRALVA